MIRLDANPAGFGDIADELNAADFVSDVPVQHSYSFYEDEEIGLSIGLWDTDAMTEAGGPYLCDEFMWLIEGSCAIRNNKTGEVETVYAGMPFVIPKGYDCQWQQSEYLRKFYVISEHPKEDIPAAPAHEGIVILDVDPLRNISYEDRTGRFWSGTWSSAAIKSEQRPFAHNEFAYVQEGAIMLTDSDGNAEVFNAGDAFFVPSGTVCSVVVENNVVLFKTVVKSD